MGMAEYHMEVRRGDELVWSDDIVADGYGDAPLFKVFGKLTDLGLPKEDIDDLWDTLNSEYKNEHGELNLDQGQTWAMEMKLREGNPLNVAAGWYSFRIHHLP